jgi:hypothetical protein
MQFNFWILDNKRLYSDYLYYIYDELSVPVLPSCLNISIFAQGYAEGFGYP